MGYRICPPRRLDFINAMGENPVHGHNNTVRASRDINLLGWF